MSKGRVDDASQLPQPSLVQKWESCLERSKSLSSDSLLQQWQASRTQKLEEWGQLINIKAKHVETQLRKDPDISLC